ncbi:unnamed protein product [Merluccius merluccius]
MMDNYDKSYNIPVCVWLDDSYPLTAPLCYVKPTPEMMTIRGKHVDSNGEVTLPYLQEWNQALSSSTNKQTDPVRTTNSF